MSRSVRAVLTVASLSLVASPAYAEQAATNTARIVAQALAEAVSARNADAAAALCALPTNLDGDVVDTAEALLDRWRRALARADLGELVLEQVEVLALSDAIARHGPPPRRLGELEPTSLVAVIRWNRAQLVAVLAERDGRWTVIAVTD